MGAGWGRGAEGGWGGGERGLWMGRCAKARLSIFERGLTEKRGWPDLYHKMLYYVVRCRAFCFRSGV